VASCRRGVAAGKERDLMATAHQLLREHGNDPFGTTVLRWRNRFEWGSDLSDAHAIILRTN
jgi:hypothetical protein